MRGMSGHAENAITRRGPLSDEATLLHKPFSIRDLGLAVRRVLDSRAAPARAAS